MVVVTLFSFDLLQPWGQVVWRHLVEAVDLLTGSTPKQRRSSSNHSAKLLLTCGEEGRRFPALHTQKNLWEGNSWSTGVVHKVGVIEDITSSFRKKKILVYRSPLR
jgi:hypothetical protein